MIKSDEAKARRDVYMAAYRAANAEKAKATTKAWREANGEASKAQRAQYRKANAAAIKASKAAYYAANADAINARKAAHYAANAATHKARMAAYDAANRHQTRARKAKRKAAKIQATPAWADKRAIDQYYLIASYLSAELGIEFHVDHVVPLHSKIVCGLHAQTNMSIALGSWNIAKGNRIWPDMPQQIAVPTTSITC